MQMERFEKVSKVPQNKQALRSLFNEEEREKMIFFTENATRKKDSKNII